MAKKVLCLATSFLDFLVSHPPEEAQAKRMLNELAEYSNGEIEIIYRCDRNPQVSLRAEEFENITAVIADLEEYDRKLLSRVGIKAGGSLELIARYGIGYNSVDVQAATDYGVIVTNCPGCNALPTAEWTHSTILDIAGRRISHYKTASRGKSKEGPSRLDISGKILGVIGTGLIGKLVLKLMKGYEMKVIAHDPYPDRNWAKENKVEYVGMNELCQTADIITLHAAANETIITREQIDLMKHTTVLVNCAREVLVDYKAAYNAIRAGKLWGYGVGSDSDNGKIGMQLMSTQSVVNFLHGEIPQHIVNEEVLVNIQIRGG